MNIRTQILCAWCGPAFAVLFGLGFFLTAGFLPPHPPAASAQDIANIYADGDLQIRAGMMLGMYATGFYGPWTAIMYVLMRRIEGNKAPVLSLSQLISGTLGVTVFLLPCMIWTVAAFRSESSPEIIQMLNDFAWLFLTVVVAPFIFQYLAFGMAVLQDDKPQPLIPRWLGYFTIWAAIIFIPAGMIPFFKTGVFAWTGIIAFWLPAGTFFVSLFIMAHYFVRAIRNQAYEQQ
tara:strand:+ start:456 stop:1154 length:699 start_codon:yes stop_codon:yes gene_type:complete